MPPFHLSAVPATNPRRVRVASAREGLRQELRGAAQPEPARLPLWFRGADRRHGAWLPR